MDQGRQENYEHARNKMKQYVGQLLTYEMIKAIHSLVVGPAGQHGYRTEFAAPPIMHEQTRKVVYLGTNAGSGQTANALSELLNWFYLCDLTVPNIELAALMHWEIAKIHPFKDGNGRTARILTLYVLLSQGYDEADSRLLEQYFDNSRSQYEKALDDGHFTYQGFNKVSPKWVDYVRKWRQKLYLRDNICLPLEYKSSHSGHA